LKYLPGIKIRLNWNYLLISQVLLLMEVFIGVFIHDQFVRPYAGDFLVVIMLYCFVRACIDLRVFPVALTVLLFSYFVEWTQYLQLADFLHLNHHSLLRVLIGDYFCWTDIFCYTGGILTVILLEELFSRLISIIMFFNDYEL
jgi:hypothetical protein